MHIFFADDDRIMRTLTGAQIDLNGHTHTAFEDGDELLAALSATPDAARCVFLDRDMERMGGIETLTALKANTDTAHIPVFILTGDGLETYKQQALEAGAAGYLIKPVTPEIIQQAVQSIST